MAEVKIYHEREKAAQALIERRLRLEEFTAEMEKLGVHVVQPREMTSDGLRGGYTRFFPLITGDFVTGGSFH